MLPEVKWKTKLALAAVLLCTLSACGPQEIRTTVSDFCLNDRRISVSVEPGSGAEDATPGNQYDTDQTVFEVLAHNEVHDRLCATRTTPAR